MALCTAQSQTWSTKRREQFCTRQLFTGTSTCYAILVPRFAMPHPPPVLDSLSNSANGLDFVQGWWDENISLHLVRDSHKHYKSKVYKLLVQNPSDMLFLS